MRKLLHFVLLWFLAVEILLAAEPTFDLVGPRVDVRVKRDNQTLPIGEVPNLMAGDRLWVHADLPETQSAHFVLVIAFLRGVTNPPPPEWFTRVETWNKEVRSEGIFLTVPADAQQAILFLAPETGGDFSTLRNAVRGRPGAFVRATQDLLAASWERMRLESYLAEVRATSVNDPKSLKARTEMAARSLGIRLDQQCFDKPTDQQVPCLSAHTDGTVLDDSNAATAVDQWTSGNSRDLMNQISSTPVGRAGAYSPYIGAIVDTARILSSLHTAKYQYIPALALPTKDTLNLRLSVPPSFRDPKSVVVVALPPVGPAHMPALHPVNPGDAYCAQKPGLVLPAEGAPLVFASQMAHELSLRIETKNGPVEVKLHPDASLGGFVLENPPAHQLEEEMVGTLHGKWGFDDWEGPRFHLRFAHPSKWTPAPSDQSALVVGREDVLHLEDDSLCLDRVGMIAGTAPELNLNWKSPHSGSLEVTVPLKTATPGPVTFHFYQYGMDKPDALQLQAYSEAASLERLTMNAGNTQATLRGNRLDEVAGAKFGEIDWTPAELTRVQEFDQLTLETGANTNALTPGKKITAEVRLRDGRELKIPVQIDPPRPQLTLLSKGTQDEASANALPVRLGSSDDLLLSNRIVFFLRSVVPARFPRTSKVEVAAEDGSFRTQLSLSDASLILEDARTVMGTLDPLARFGFSAFGPIQLRAISAEGITGDWIPLGTLVRLPNFRDLRCPHAPNKPCVLTGSNLFLLLAVSASQDFENGQEVPPDFTGTQLNVPHPVNGQLWVKLRDEPDSVQTLTLPVTTLNAPPPVASTPAAAPAQSQDQAPATPVAQDPAPPAPEAPAGKNIQ